MQEHILDKRSIFISKFTGDVSKIEKNIDSIKNLDKGRTISNINGYQSNAIPYGFTELVKEVGAGVKEILNIEKPLLSSFWVNINNGFSKNKTHVHAHITENSFFSFSCVYYHKVCCDKSPIVFESLIPSIFTKEHTYYPQSQDIIFFWGSIPHRVEPCMKENHERISIAFNFTNYKS